VLRLGKGITIKPRRSNGPAAVQVTETRTQLESGSEYEPRASQSESPGPDEVEIATPSPSEEEIKTGTDTELVDSNEDDDEGIAGDGPSSRTRAQSFSQNNGSKFRALWSDDSPSRNTRSQSKGDALADVLFPDEEEEEEEHGPVPTSSPSLGGGGRSRVGSMGPGSPVSPTRHRMVVEVLVPSPSRLSQQNLSQGSRAADTLLEEPVTHEAPVSEARDDEVQILAGEDDKLPEDGQDGVYARNDPDQSLAHAMEIDELLAGDVSHHSAENATKLAAEGDSYRGDASGSVIDLTDSTMDVTQSVLDLDLDENRVADFMDTTVDILPPAVEPIFQHPPVDPASQPQPTQSDSQLPSSSASPPKVLKAVTETASAFLPRLLSESSQSQHLISSQDPAPVSQEFLPPPQLQSQPQPQPQSQSQPQDHTHSSIEEPSSWTFPPPGQIPHPSDTISSFTPTNPSTKAPPTAANTSGEQHPLSSSAFPPSSGALPPAITADGHVPEPLPTQSSVEMGRNSPPSTFSTLGPVPDLSADIFQRRPSPGSDIGQFSSPIKSTTTFLGDASTSLEPRPRGVLGIRPSVAGVGSLRRSLDRPNGSQGYEDESALARAAEETEGRLAGRILTCFHLGIADI
jgi:hypothetical protein